VRAVSATAWPFAANARAIASPIPEPAPVTQTTFGIVVPVIIGID